MRLEVLLEGGAYLVRVIDPEDSSLLKTDAARLLTAANGATASFRVYDAEVRTRLRTDYTGAGAFFVAEGWRHFAVGDQVVTILDDLSREHSTIASIDPATAAITLDDDPTGPFSKRGRVWKAYGDGTALPMAEYGTPAQGSEAWGFQGTLPADLAGLVVPSFLRIEALFVGAVGGNLERLLTAILPFDEASA